MTVIARLARAKGDSVELIILKMEEANDYIIEDASSRRSELEEQHRAWSNDPDVVYLREHSESVR